MKVIKRKTYLKLFPGVRTVEAFYKSNSKCGFRSLYILDRIQSN